MFQILARKFSDTLASIRRLGEGKSSEGASTSLESALCVVLKDPCTRSPANPGVAADVPGTETVPAGAGEVETSSTSDNALGIEVLLVSSG